MNNTFLLVQSMPNSELHQYANGLGLDIYMPNITMLANNFNNLNTLNNLENLESEEDLDELAASTKPISDASEEILNQLRKTQNDIQKAIQNPENLKKSENIKNLENFKNNKNNKDGDKDIISDKKSLLYQAMQQQISIQVRGLMHYTEQKFALNTVQTLVETALENLFDINNPNNPNNINNINNPNDINEQKNLKNHSNTANDVTMTLILFKKEIHKTFKNNI